VRRILEEHEKGGDGEEGNGREEESREKEKKRKLPPGDK